MEDSAHEGHIVIREKRGFFPKEGTSGAEEAEKCGKRRKRKTDEGKKISE